jgi:hypothetical protein
MHGHERTNTTTLYEMAEVAVTKYQKLLYRNCSHLDTITGFNTEYILQRLPYVASIRSQ